MAETILNTLNGLFEQYTVFIISYFVALNSVYLLLIVFSFLHIRRQIKEKDVFQMHGLFASNLYNPISVLAPAYNEESTVVDSVHSLLQLRFPNYEVIVINDGSKDRTMDVLMEEFQLERIQRYVPLILDHKPIKGIYRSRRFSELIVVDKENGRKADALNAGINVCRNDLFCAIDADCVLEPEVLQNMLRSFIEDETTIAVGGIVRVANDCVIEGNEIKEIRMPKAFLARVQVVEYLRAFLFGRVGWDFMDSLLIISGAFGIFDRNAVLRVGGYLHDTVGEDMELVVRMHRYHRENKIPYRVRFLPEPVCWTEVPEDMNVLARQRNRWHRGLADTMWRHKKMLLNPRYGRLGMFAMPFYLLFELLSPIIELLGYIIVILMLVLGMFNSTFAALIFTATVLLGVVLSVASVLCEEYTFRRYTSVKDVLIMIAFAFIENFGFRQVHAYWRFKGLVDFAKGNKEWGAMQRKGFKAQTEPTAAETRKPDYLTVSQGMSDQSPVGHKVEGFDTYNARAAEIREKYAGSRIQYEDEDVVEDDIFENAFNRRSWTKTILPVSILFASLLLMGLWIWSVRTPQLTVTGNEDDTVTLVMQESATDFAGIPSIGIGPSALPVQFAGVTGAARTAIASDAGRLDEGAAGAGTSSQPARPAEPGVTAPTVRSADTPAARLSPVQETRYFIAEHLYAVSDVFLYIDRYAQRAATLGYQLYVRPQYSPAFASMVWHVGFGPFSSGRQAMAYARLHQMDINQIQIVTIVPRDARIFHSLDSAPRWQLELGSFEDRGQRDRLAARLASRGFTRLRTPEAYPFKIYTGGYATRADAEALIRFTLPQFGIHDAKIVPFSD